MSAETRPEFVTLYEIAAASVATSTPYLDRLNAPTQWTRRATSHFRNTSRALTEVLQSEGAGPDAALAAVAAGVICPLSGSCQQRKLRVTRSRV
jgi:hypothetical protein